MSQGESERVKNTFQLTIVRRKSISNDALQKIKIYTKETVLHNFIINVSSGLQVFGIIEVQFFTLKLY